MTCAHVLGLIDAGPFAEYPPGHLETAWTHARGCPTCGPAMAVTTALTAELRALSSPDAPDDLASIVTARIAQLPEPASAGAPSVTQAAVPLRRRDWAPTVTALGGLAAGLALILTMPSGTEVLADLVTPRFRPAGLLATVPSSGSATLAIGAGLLLYAVGLFAPVRSES